MCKCRDTGSKRCRWEHPNDSHNWNMKQVARLDRKRVRVELAKFTKENKS